MLKILERVCFQCLGVVDGRTRWVQKYFIILTRIRVADFTASALLRDVWSRLLHQRISRRTSAANLATAEYRIISWIFVFFVAKFAARIFG